MKLILAAPTIYTAITGAIVLAYQYPVHFLVIVIGLMFLLHVIQDAHLPTFSSQTSSYDLVKEVFNDPSSPNYIPTKLAPTTRRVACVPVDFSDWDYKSLQIVCKSLGIKANQSKSQLIVELNNQLATN
jgi:hypothetical protein